MKMKEEEKEFSDNRHHHHQSFSWPRRSSGHHRWFCSQFSPILPVLHCPLGLTELQASPFHDVVFPPLPLPALSSSPFHCALQDGFGQTWWTGDMSVPLQSGGRSRQGRSVLIEVLSPCSFCPAFFVPQTYLSCTHWFSWNRSLRCRHAGPAFSTTSVKAGRNELTIYRRNPNPQIDPWSSKGNVTH